MNTNASSTPSSTAKVQAPDLEQLRNIDRKHWIHPVVALRQHEERGATIWKSAQGIHLTDMQGHRVQDAFSGLWCVNTGYGHESIVQAATQQMRELPYVTGYFHFASEAAIRLAGRLTELAPERLTRVLFGQGGSDAVDTAVRVVRYFFNATGRPAKKHFIGLQRAYHGTSATGSGLTALPLFHNLFDVPTVLQHHIPSPYTYRHSDGPDPEAVLRATILALENKVAEIGADNVAAFICEPVQGSGGVIVPPAGFLRAVRAACDRLDILMIVDEVITGFGRTGPMFACEHEDVSPDLMTVAKGLTAGYAPMSATFISEEIYQGVAQASKNETPFGHGQTYAGHPVSAAVANAVIDLYTDGGLIANGLRMAPYFEKRLRELELFTCVGEIRVKGLLAGIELVADKATKAKPDPAHRVGQRVFEHAFKNGLFFRAFNDDILGFAPSLNYTERDVDFLVDTLRTSMEEVGLR